MLNEVLIANLADFEFNGFEEQDEALVAYIGADDFGQTEKTIVEQLVAKHQLSYITETVADQNWNAQWESDYQPVLVDDFCAVRATFHEPIKSVKHEIVITPKMSFGTGHHATTWMMMKQMEQLSIDNNVVFKDEEVDYFFVAMLEYPAFLLKLRLRYKNPLVVPILVHQSID